jgi:hypothetical protein
MGGPEKSGKADGSATGDRRSTRLAIAIPVSISGKDSRDQTFKENTRTVIINKHGAKIVTFHELALGSEILLENRALGRSARTFVVWLGDRRTAKDAQEVGVQLSEPQNIWGIDFAPDDWQEGPPIGEGGQRLEKLPAPSAPPPAPVAAPSAVAESAPAGVAAPAAVSPAEIEAALQARFQEFERKLNEHIEQSFTKNQARMEIAANRHEQMIEQGLDERFGGLEKRLEAERRNLEQLLAQVRDVQKATHDSVENTRRNIQAATEEMNQKVRGQLESATAKFSEEVRRQVEEIRVKALDSLTQEGKAIARDYPGQVRKMLQDFQDQRTRELEDHLQKALEKQRQAILKQIQLVGEDEAEKAAAQVKTKCEEVAHIMLGDLDRRESTLKEWEEGASGRLEAYSQLLEGSARASAETFQEQASEVLTSTMERLKKDAGSLEESLTREIAARIQEASRQQIEVANREFEKRTEDSLELAAEQLKEKQEEIIGEAGEVFRTTLGQMLLGSKKEPEPPSKKRR